jgi:hypothetical protein
MTDPYEKYIRPMTPSADGCDDCVRSGSRGCI